MDVPTTKNAFRNLSLLACFVGVLGCAATTPKPTDDPSARSVAAGITRDGETKASPGDGLKKSRAARSKAASAETNTLLAEHGPQSAESHEEASAAAEGEFEPAIEVSNAAAGEEVYPDLWERIRAGFKLAPMEHPYVEQHARWFANNPAYMERMLQRANVYLFHIVEEVEKRGMPMEIALLPAIESAYQPRALSHARASGLWQFIPSTGRLYGLRSNWWYDGRRDVMASTKAALDYLQKLHDDFNGDWQLALAAYNAGEGRIMRAVEYNRRHGLPTDFLSLRKLPKETRHYVPKLMAMVSIVADPDRYGLELSEIPNSPYFVQVDAGSQIDLAVVAKLADVPLEDLYDMNPGFQRRATAPDGPHQLLVPASSKEAFEQALSELPADQRLQWARHRVRRGESLGYIARRYDVSVEAIKTTNKLRGNRIIVGHDLLIPVAGRRLITASGDDQRAATASAATKARKGLYHRVKRGETLWSIARRYHVLVKELAKWNYLSPDAMVRTGQKLRIFPPPSGTKS